MKNILKTFAILFLLINTNCKAQQLVQAPNDAYKLKANEQQFLDKPLKDLLVQIKPEIKTAWATSGDQSYFSFYFINPENFKDGRAIGQNHLGLFVYVKEKIDWKYENRPPGKELLWTKDDIQKYGDLTVTRIRVIGKE